LGFSCHIREGKSLLSESVKNDFIVSLEELEVLDSDQSVWQY
jgi:hypothetical protein